MALADFDIGVGPTLAAQSQQRMGGWVLFGLLCIFTLTTMDGGDVVPRIISAILLGFGGFFFALPPGFAKFNVSLPAACLLGMTAWGILQTLFFKQKIVANGWSGVLFWFTAAVIALLGTSIFRRPDVMATFRRAFIYFSSAVCVLDLLEQTSGTNRYYWFMQSRYATISGPFAYWNNFAQFVELSLPITLWQGLARTRPSPVYLVLSAVQICAVVASGSRAGSVLVIVELVMIVALAYLRYRNKTFLIGASMAVVLTLLFVYAAGSSTVVSKLQESDQLSVRRSINESSLAMIAARPITGWGLESYVPVYRMFALYDDGTYVNRAHNDWLQFAAEGGLPFVGLMAVIFVWSIRPAIRSGWGIGVIAVCLHAFVDYPFARFGVCGWYFAIVSMMCYERVVEPIERDKPARENIY